MRVARSWRALLCASLSLLAASLVAAASAGAARPLLEERVISPQQEEALPTKQIEGVCGVALNSSGRPYLSDYYHRAVELFNGGGVSLIPTVHLSPEGPCGLATAPDGALYVNYYHQGVGRLLPSVQSFDEGNSTGVAVDGAGNVYVDDRTYVAAYEPSGESLLREGQPLRIGLGSIGDGYGVAVGDGVVYVADAEDNTVKAYEPAVSAPPSMVIDGSEVPGGNFSSLTDAALAVDPTNGHLVVVDNLQPEYEHPEAAIYEFSETGGYLGKAEGNVIDGEPTGLAFDLDGKLYATTGNSEGANVSLFGAYEVGLGAAGVTPASGGNAGGTGGGAAALSRVEVAEPVGGPAATSATASPQHEAKAHRKLKHRHRGKAGKRRHK
jgi:hypothetical protein